MEETTFRKRIEILFEDNKNKQYAKAPIAKDKIYATNQTELAEAINISRQSISSYMNGSSTPSLDIAMSIAQHFKVSLDYLTGRSEYKSLSPDIKRACMYTGLSENAVRILNESKDSSNHPFGLAVISQLIESGILNQIAYLLERSLVNAHQYNFLYGDGDETEIKASMLESDEYQFNKIVMGLYPLIIKELTMRLEKEIISLSDNRWQTILEQAEITIDKMQGILSAVDEDTWKAYQAQKIEKMISSQKHTDL